MIFYHVSKPDQR